MAVIAKQRYKLDITPQGGWVIIYASQHDDEAREIEFEIINQGKVFSIPASINVSVQGIKSNSGYFSHSCSYSGNIVTMALADDMTDVTGKAICVLKFTNQSNQKLATAKFVLNVDTDASSEGVIIDTEAEEIFNQMLNDIRAQAASVSADIAELQSMVGSPLVASTVSAMTDHNKIYVYTGSESGYTNGNWYYWNGSAWTSGGVYNSVAINIDSVPTHGSSNAVSSGGVYNVLDTLQAQIPQIDTTLMQAGQAADAKETGDKITGLEEVLGELSCIWVDGKSIMYSGDTFTNPDYSYATAYVHPGAIISGYTRGGLEKTKAIAFYKADGSFISSDYNSGSGSYNWNYSLSVPDDAYIVKISCGTAYKTAFTLKILNVINQISKNAFDIGAQKKDITLLETISDNSFGNIRWINNANFGVGSLAINQSGAIYYTNNDKRVRQIIGTEILLKANSELYLSDYSHYRFIVFTSTDSGTTWVQGTWITSGKHIVSVDALYLVIIEDTTATTADVDTLVGLLQYDEYGTFANTIEKRLEIVENSKKNTAKFAHFSFDDVRFCMIDLMNNANTYTSIFDNPFFAMLKEIHDACGAIFSLYLFLVNTDSDISDYPSKFATEFMSNSDWLKFGIHQGGTNYANTSAETALSDYNTFTSNIVRICGTVDVIDRCPRLGNFAGNLDSVLAMREANAGIVGLLSAYDTRDSYYLTSEESEYTFKHGKYVDTANRLTFYRTIKTFEVSNPSTALPALKTLAGVNGSNYAIMMMHEYAVYTDEYELINDMKTRIVYACNWANQNGYEWVYPMDKIF